MDSVSIRRTNNNEITEGEPFSIIINTEGEQLALSIPSGLTLVSGPDDYAENGSLLVTGDVTLTFTAVAGNNYSLQLKTLSEDNIGEPLVFSVSAVAEEEGISAAGSISGLLWLDANDDKTKNSGDAAVPNYPVSLYLGADVIATVNTDANGNYVFANLAPGTYVISILPNELGANQYLFPIAGVKNDNDFIVASDWLSAISNPITITGSESVTDVDAAMRTPAGIMPLPSGTPGTMAATIVDDNGTVNLNGSGDNDTAVMSYQQTQNHVTTNYNLAIQLTGLDPSAENIITVTLPHGMKFPYTNIDTFLNTTGQFKSDVLNAAYSHAGYATLGDYTFPNGTYTFTLKPGVSATSVSIPITFDPTIQTDTITNAVEVTLSDGTNSVTQVLEKVTRPIDPGIAIDTHTIYHGTYFPFSAGDVHFMHSKCNTIKTTSTGNPYSIFITEGVYKLVLNDMNKGAGDVRATIVNTDTTGEWALDDSLAASGEYTFTYTPAAGNARRSALVLPYKIVFDAAPTVPWNTDDTVTLTYVAADTYNTYLQFAADTPAGNIGSTISATASPKHLVSNVVHTFKYKMPDELVFVNYLNVTEYLSNSVNPAKNLSFDADVESADPLSSVANDYTGILGFFLMGNAGTVDSAAKTVEMHFDSTNFGVMALNVPYRVGETLTHVEFTTTSNPSWQTATVSATSNGYGIAYLSYVNLGIGRNEFITGIRYKFGSVPAGSVYSTYSDPGVPYFGKWLTDTMGATAQATIEVYDTDPSGGNTTGPGTVTTKSIDTYAIGYPNISSNVIALAGAVMDFSIQIHPSNNTAYLNATTELPVYYIRSELKDENGNLLPVTNIKLTTYEPETIPASALNITNWTVDEDGDGYDDAIIYKIDTDTASVDKNKVVLAPRYIRSNGQLAARYTTLSYQIPTTALTPTQTYNMRDMVFVFDKDAINSVNSSASVRIMPANPFYNGIEHGEGWAKGVLTARSTMSTNTYQINNVQSILVTSQIKHNTATSWINYHPGDTPIPVGISAGSGFQLKTNIINNAGALVTGTEVYIPIPKMGENWGTLASKTEMSLVLKNAATVDPTMGSGTIGTHTVKYGINVTPTASGTTLQGYTWVDASAVSDWSLVNCVKITAATIADQANLQVILDVNADENTPAEGLVDIWHPLYYQDLSSPSGTFNGWYAGAYFGVQSALSAIKGRLFIDSDNDGVYDGTTENTNGTGWIVKIYDVLDTSVALQEKNLSTDGTYAFYDLVESSDYVIEATNPNSAHMFTRTVTRAAGNGTGSYGPWGANTFVSSDSDITATASANAILTTVALPPNDIADKATYNIGIATKTNSTLTWQSADTTKGTVSGTGVVSGVKTLSGSPGDLLPAGAAPTLTPATNHIFVGWARVNAGDPLPANPTVWKTAAAILNKDFGDGNGKFGFDSYDYYALFEETPQHKVTYEVTGDAPTPVNGMPSPLSYDEYEGATVTVAANPTTLATTKGSIPGTWTFSGWSSGDVSITGAGDSFTMPDHDVKIKGTWVFKPNSINPPPLPPKPFPPKTGDNTSVIGFVMIMVAIAAAAAIKKVKE